MRVVSEHQFGVDEQILLISRKRWLFDALGAVSVNVEVEVADALPPPARIGLHCQLATVQPQVEWLGLGPHENYPDRRLAAQHGRWRLPLADLHTPYIFPGENGLRCDTRSLRYGGWRIDGRFHFSLSRYGLQLMACSHQHLLQPEAGTWLHLDGFHMGWAATTPGARACTGITCSPPAFTAISCACSGRQRAKSAKTQQVAHSVSKQSQNV